jgi:hypothetical protein
VRGILRGEWEQVRMRGWVFVGALCIS